MFAALPLFHVNALVVTVLAPLFRGLQVVWAGPQGYRDQALYSHFWKLVERYRVTTMSAVPTVYSVLAGCPVDADISSLRFAVVGASPLPQAVRDGFESATGIRLVEGYGLTEATCVSALSFPDHPRPGSVGQRLPYQQVKAVQVTADGEWVDLPAGQVGRARHQRADRVPRLRHRPAVPTGPCWTAWASCATAGWTPGTWPGSTSTASSTSPAEPRT